MIYCFIRSLTSTNTWIQFYYHFWALKINSFMTEHTQALETLSSDPFLMIFWVDVRWYKFLAGRRFVTPTQHTREFSSFVNIIWGIRTKFQRINFISLCFNLISDKTLTLGHWKGWYIWKGRHFLTQSFQSTPSRVVNTRMNWNHWSTFCISLTGKML